MGCQSDGEGEEVPNEDLIDQLQEIANSYKSKYEMVKNHYDALKA